MNEVCPSCGAFVAVLYEYTGWCASCSYTDGRECSRCHQRQSITNFSKDSARGSGRRPVCRRCDSAARTARALRRVATA